MLGLCCHYLVPGKKPGTYQNLLKQRSLQLGRWHRGDYSMSHLKQTWIDNLNTLNDNLSNVFKTYQVFRFPSGILPLWDQVHPDVYEKDSDIIDLFADIGDKVIGFGVRATFHPGQFCSLSSDNPAVCEAAVKELNHHAWQFDMMNLPQNTFYAINIHGGKRDRHKNLVCAINGTNNSMSHRRLTNGARHRLTLENDEMCYSVVDLLHVYNETGVPIVFDSHHHVFNDATLNSSLASEAAKQTWGNIKPLQHISNTGPDVLPHASFQKRRAHSDFIAYIVSHQLDDVQADIIDLDVEAKMKNLAIDKMKIRFKISS